MINNDKDKIDEQIKKVAFQNVHESNKRQHSEYPNHSNQNNDMNN